MKKKNLLIITAVIVLIAGSAYLLTMKKTPASNTPPQNTNTGTGTQLSELPDDWQTYTSPELGFAINHPADVKPESMQEGIRFLKLGETQSVGTELYDGLSLLISAADLNGKPLEDIVRTEYEKSKNDPVMQSVTPMTAIKFANFSAYSFTADGLGTSTFYFLENDKNGYIKITDMTVEPSNQTRDFRKTVSQMLNTFQITGNPTGDIVTSADDAPSGSVHNLPVPKAVSAVKSFASRDLNVPEGKVIILSAYEEQWSDSCLGLAQEGEMCAQVITPGYEITVEAGGKQKVYRTNSEGTIIKIK